MNKNKQIDSAYKTRLSTLNKKFITHKDTGLIIFVESLKYLRDSLITQPLGGGTEIISYKTKIATLDAAILEFEAYRTCVQEDKKDFHWNNFCNIFKLNMKEWLELNDSI